MEYLKIGEYTPLTEEADEVIHRAYYRQGMIFKDEEAFLLHPDQICYVPELSDATYTHQDFLNLCNGQEKFAKECFYDIVNNLDILFMSTKYDTNSILELDSIENIVKKLWDMGISIVVLKSKEKGGYYTGYNGNIAFTEFYTKDVVDTTCSGDAFNGAFMYALTNGYTPFEAAKLASITAGLQAKGVGAVKSVPHAEDVFAVYSKGGN